MGAKTKAQIRSEQLQQLLAEQEEHNNKIKAAMKSSAFARCAAVEDLYELLGIEPTAPQHRQRKDGTIEQRQSDRAEDKRAARLVKAVGKLLERLEKQQELIKALEAKTGQSSTGSTVQRPEHQAAGAR